MWFLCYSLLCLILNFLPKSIIPTSFWLTGCCHSLIKRILLQLVVAQVKALQGVCLGQDGIIGNFCQALVSKGIPLETWLAGLAVKAWSLVVHHKWHPLTGVMTLEGHSKNNWRTLGWARGDQRGSITKISNRISKKISMSNSQFFPTQN